MGGARASILGGVLVAGALASGAARADEAPLDPTAHHHDGFYLRMGLGPGYLHDSLVLESSDANGNHASYDGSVKGGGVALELSFGGSVAPGFVVGGGLFHTLAVSRTVDTAGIDTQVKSVYGHFLVAPFVDVYPDPGSGFHLEGGVGLAISNNVNVSNQVTVTTAPIGFGGFAGVGYETWVANQWSMGGLLRLSAIRVQEKQDNLLPFFPLVSTSQWKVTHTGVEVALLGTVTFN